ncbi:MAG: hypothetical protein IJT31_03910 [Oscillibacter sp.]|nr:hypothetical protein [Oscillibacter sp.]
MSRNTLRSLIDLVDESELDTVYKILIRFIREDAILPDEAESLAAARRDRERGDVLSHEEVWA